MGKVLISVWCILLIFISVESLPFPGAKNESVEAKLLSGDGFRSRLRFTNVEKRDDSDYSYSAEVHKWNSHEAEVDMKKREIRSSDDLQKKMLKPPFLYANIGSEDGFFNTFEIEDSMEHHSVSNKEIAVPFRKILRALVPVSTLKEFAFDKKESANETVSLKIQDLTCQEKEAILEGLLDLLLEFSDDAVEFSHSAKRRSLDLFKGVKSLTDVVKSINPLEEAVNSENIFHGSSKDKNGRSVIKENAQNFLPSGDRAARYAQSDIDTDECIECAKPSVIRSEQKRSDVETDDFFNMENPKETSTEATTVSTTKAHHHHRKGSRKHLKPKAEHANELSYVTLEPNNFTSSSNETMFGEKRTRSKRGTTIETTSATHKPHEEHAPLSHTEKNHTAAGKEVSHGKKEKKFTSLRKEHDTTTQSTEEIMQGGRTVLPVADRSQKMKDAQIASVIDGKPKFLKGASSERKGLLSDVLRENSPLDAEGIAASDNRPKSLQESHDENTGKVKQTIEVGGMKINIEPGDNKGEIKRPMMIDTKVLISGSDPKDVFSIGKMKGLLLLGESQDFVSGGAERDLTEKTKHGKSRKQEESSDDSEANEDQEELHEKPKGSGSKQKNLLPSGREKSFLGVLSENVPFLGDETKGVKDRYHDVNSHDSQPKQNEAQNLAKATSVEQTTGTFENKTVPEEIQRVHSSVDNVTPADLESNISTSENDTFSASQLHGGGIFESIDTGKGRSDSPSEKDTFSTSQPHGGGIFESVDTGKGRFDSPSEKDTFSASQLHDGGIFESIDTGKGRPDSPSEKDTFSTSQPHGGGIFESIDTGKERFHSPSENGTFSASQLHDGGIFESIDTGKGRPDSPSEKDTFSTSQPHGSRIFESVETGKDRFDSPSEKDTFPASQPHGGGIIESINTGKGRFDSPSEKDTFSTSQPHDGGIFESIETGKVIASLTEDNLPLDSTNKAKNILPSKYFEVPSFPAEAPKSILPKENFKIFEDSESFFKEVEQMNLTDTKPDEKASDVNEYTGQLGEKQRDSLQSDAIQANEKHSKMSIVKEAEILPTAVEEINTESVILTDVSKPKTEEVLPNMKPHGLLDEKVPKEELVLNKKFEDYGHRKFSTEVNETNEPLITEDQDVFEEFGEGQTVPEESDNIPAVVESDFGEGDDQPVPESSVNGELTEDVISPEMGPKDLVASLNKKGFMSFGDKPNIPRFPQRNRYFVPQEKSLLNDDTPIHDSPQMYERLIPNNDGKGLADTFVGSADFIPREEQKDVLPDFPKNGQNSDNVRGRQRLRLEQQDSESEVQQTKGLRQLYRNHSEPVISDIAKSYMLGREESRGMAQGFMDKPEKGAVDKRGRDPTEHLNPSQEKQSDGSSNSGIVQTKNLEHQFLGDQSYAGKYPQYQSMNAYNPNPYASYYGGDRGFKDTAGQVHPALSRFYNAQDNADSRDLMPGFGSYL